ncbi:thioredoxin domain-containing protein [Nocardia sp. 2]|uniref:Thioredoxin domain-containing protein n=1 Tax=Nocardia acididurans TaxID=2802282 RepID=A0ABS1MF88_9NOCA|nr:thioredoxin domain-containing protein [Nocardia acididurans]MBL1078936.1 thioredoxin domain-containing protein [Nocardia acididurans]
MSARDRLSTRLTAAVAVLLLIVVAGIVWAVSKAARDKDSGAADRERAALAAGPAPFESGRLRFGDPAAPVTLVLIEDFQCPLCKSLDTVSGATIDAAVEDGKAAIEYDIVAVLDAESTTEYSSRAANASVCVAVADKEKWRAFRALAFQRQPATGSAGLGDAELIDLARQAGVVDPGLDECVTARRHRDFVAAHTRADVAGGLLRVPMLLADGTEVVSPTPEGITAAVKR